MDGAEAIAFGEFRLDLVSERLQRNGAAIALTPKAYSLLRFFLAHPDRLLSKDELLDAVWPDVTVSDTVLKVCVGELRRALDDDAASPRYVATVHRRGYRFVAAVAHEARRATASPAEPAARPVANVVGRAQALAELETALAGALGGTREVVFVTGEAGIGKTTLVETFLAGLDPTVLRARGHCLEQFGAGEPYLPLLDALGRLARPPAPGFVVTTLRRAAPTWMAAVPGLDAAGDAVAPSRTRMLLELVEGLETLAQQAPLVLVLEDLHWSDYSTLDLLSLLARRPDPARLLVIGTYRPVELVVLGHPLRRLKDDLALRRHCREIPLEFLTESDVERYLAARLASDALPAGIAALVHARTDGNPLFMTHVVDLLLARGALAPDGDGWRVAPGVVDDPTLVPDTLRLMITHELAAVAPEERRVLDAASVAGVEPSAAAVAAALGDPLAAVEDSFVALARRGQLVTSRGADVWPDGTRTARFAFIHALYQHTLYQELAPSRRAELHQRVGERLERAFAAASDSAAPTRDAAAPELAQHFTAAGDTPRANVYLRRAAERALRRHAYPEAIAHLERALALLAPDADDAPRAARELELRMMLGPALMAVHGFAAPEVEQCYARARALCRTVGTTPERSPALRGLAVFSLTRGDLLQARELAEESLALAESGGDGDLLAKAQVTIGTTLYYLGELDAAAAQLGRARRLLSRPRTRPTAPTVQAPIVNCLAFLAMTTWFRGRPDEALALVRAARAAADALAHPLSVLWAAHVTAILHHFRDEPGAAAEAADVAIRLAHELGYRQWTAWGVFFNGWLATTEGRLADGVAGMAAGLEEYRATGAELGSVYFTATLAAACTASGDAPRALALVERALAETNANSERYFTAELHRLRAGLLDEPVAAEAELRRAVALADRQGNRALALRAATDLARLLAGVGREAAGRKMLAPLHRAFREGHETGDVRAAAALLATLQSGPRSTQGSVSRSTSRRRG